MNFLTLLLKRTCKARALTILHEITIFLLKIGFLLKKRFQTLSEVLIILDV